MNLTTSISGIEIKNPLMPASGPLVGDYEKMLILQSFGLGAMVTKTISVNAAAVPRPCIYGDNNKIMNAELWSEFSSEKWLEDILPPLKRDLGIPLIISAGYTKDDMEYLIPRLDSYADAFEISTHYVGKDLSVIGQTIATIRKYTNKPIFMKMSPHMPDPIGFVNTVIENGANGVVAVNSLGPSMIIDPMKRKVVVGNDKGQVWTSGPSIKPVALAIINMIREAFPNITIIGVGGISSADDIVEFLLAGADGVQMLSSAMIKGKDLYEKIIKDLPKTLQKYNFQSVEEVKKARLSKEIKFEPTYPLINENKCTACKLCERVCPYFSMKVDKVAQVNKESCFGCGLCESRCPVQAITGVL